MLRILRGVQNKIVRKQLPVPAHLVYRPSKYNNGITLVSCRNYSSEAHTGGGGGRKVLLAIGALVATGGATLAYAKHDSDFRKTLTGVAPFTDDLISLLWRENSQNSNIVVSSYNSIKDLVTGLVNKDGSDEKDDILAAPVPKSTSAVPDSYPVKPDEIIQRQDEDEDDSNEDDLKKMDLRHSESPINIVIDVTPKQKVDKPNASQIEQSSEKANVEKLRQLEQKVFESTEEAINAYSQAAFAIRTYNSDIEHFADEAPNDIKSDTWERIKTKTRSKIENVNKAREMEELALKKLNELKYSISSQNVDIPESSKQAIRDDIVKVQEALQEARNQLEQELQRGKVSEKYWDKVEKARRHFSQELESLFPNIDLVKRDLSIGKEDLDLFIIHAYSNVVFYQKELAKMETIINEKIQQAIETAQRGEYEALSDAQIREALEREKRRISLAYQRHVLKMKKEHDVKFREAMKRQSQTFFDHLEDEVKKRETEIERTLFRKFNEQLENEKSASKLQMAAVVGRLKGIDEALQGSGDDVDKEKHKIEEVAKRGQVLWSACQSLLGALTIGCPGLTWKDQIRPLSPEIKAIEKSAAEKDELVKAVINSIPTEARDRGVYPEDALRERFFKVEKVARTVALVPAEGAPLPVHLLSFLQSLLLVEAASPIPQAELNDEKIDVSKFNTNEILQRARYWLDRGDFVQTLKYMNLLKGAPRCVAGQWMDEARIYLETRQAANTLMAYAASGGLSYL
ncbi:unnamed protein product [Phyllotreta striolata]|uniref:MICOS complex subunit MIC60 n=1 Tax=Phyllotreta striolata TaxID=444603 RepID=A0A9N9XIB5_PHYSR|nr:unnamed protein product [Phyllotreta striolata]